MDEGDDDDGDSSGDDAEEDEDDEDDKDEEEEHLAPADSAIVVERLLVMTTPSPSPPISLSPPSGRERLARCMASPAHSSPLLPSFGCPTQIQTLRIASTQALIDAVTTVLPSPPLPPSLYIPPPGIRDVGYGIRDTWVDPAEAVPEIAPVTLGEVNTRVTELVELHEHDTQDLYALLEDVRDIWIVEEEAYASREACAHSIGLSQATHQEELSDPNVIMCSTTNPSLGTSDAATTTWYSHSDTASETLRVIRDMRREMSDIQAELLSLREQQRRTRHPGPEARIPDHQDASGDADSHI
ncbi:hypothetical protein Tco_0260975 [Tanacetum coccineum]